MLADEASWAAWEEGARLRAILVAYLLAQMEPTDRAVRPCGSAYPADGSRPEARGPSAMPGDAPWDGA